MSNDGHDLASASERRNRVAVAQSFGIRRQIRFDAIVFLCAAICNSETGFDFIQNKNDSVFFRLLANQFQEAGLRFNRSAISLTRFGDDRRDLIAIRTHYAFKPFKVIKRQSNHELAHGLGNPRRCLHRNRVSTIAIGFHRRIRGPQSVIVETVIISFKLQNDFASGECARYADGMHCCFRA